jgi:uncharacterized protein YecT (DUF1311 family)
MIEFRVSLAMAVASASLAITSVAHPGIEATRLRSSSVTQRDAGVPPVKYDRSCEKKAETQPAMNGCVALELQEVTPQLRSALVAESRKFSKALVSSSESIWEKYRNTECLLESSRYAGGSIYPLIRLSCELNLTVQRIEQIRQVLSANSH